MTLYNEIYKQLSDEAKIEFSCGENNNKKEKLVKACFNAMKLQRDKDYVIDSINTNKSTIYMVDKKQTGSIDLSNRRANYIDQFLSAKEYSENKNIVFFSPVPISDRVIISDVTRSYKEVSMLTATFGSAEESEHMNKFLPLGNQHEEPKVVVIEPHKKSQRHEVAPIIVPDKDILKFAQKEVDISVVNNRSLIIFVDSIKDCHELKDYLTKNSNVLKYKKNSIEIFDDKHKISPDIDQEKLIRGAAEKGHILIATRAIARGKDLPQIDMGLDLCPDATRSDEQKIGRLGRNGTFGIVKTVISESNAQLMGYKTESPAKIHAQDIGKEVSTGIKKLPDKSIIKKLSDEPAPPPKDDQNNTQTTNKKPSDLRSEFYKKIDEKTIQSSNANIEIQESVKHLKNMCKETKGLENEYQEYLEAVMDGRLTVKGDQTLDDVKQNYLDLNSRLSMN